jgi:hypothetical protein
MKIFNLARIYLHFLIMMNIEPNYRHRKANIFH